MSEAIIELNIFRAILVDGANNKNEICDRLKEYLPEVPTEKVITHIWKLAANKFIESELVN